MTVPETWRESQDGNLDIDELAVAVRSSWKSKRFQPPSNSWIFLLLFGSLVHPVCFPAGLMEVVSKSEPSS